MASRLITVLEEFATAATMVPQRIGRSRSANMPGSGDGRFHGGQEARMFINRAGTTGAVTFYGMNAADINGNPSAAGGSPAGARLRGDGATTQFQTNIPFVASSNFNWIVTSSRFLTAGTVTVTAGSTTITGSSTAFLTEYKPGMSCLVSGQTRVIDAVASDTVMTSTVVFDTAAAAVAIARVGQPISAAGLSAVTNVGGFARIDLATAPIANVELEVHFGVPVTIFTGTDRVKTKQITSYDFVWALLGATPSATSLWLEIA